MCIWHLKTIEAVAVFPISPYNIFKKNGQICISLRSAKYRLHFSQALKREKNSLEHIGNSNANRDFVFVHLNLYVRRVSPL